MKLVAKFLNVKSIVVFIGLLILFLNLYTFISPGYVGVLINLIGEKQGVVAKELHTGLHLILPWKKVYKFPVFEQNHIWDNDKSFVFQTGEGLNVNAEIGISYHLQEDKINELFCKYRRGIDEITDIFIRNYARDYINKTASKMKIEDLYGSAKESFIDQVQLLLRNDLTKLGIIVDKLYLIGTLHFPQQVVIALNSKIEATQRAEQRENELREAEAEAKKILANAQGQAKSLLAKATAQAEANNLVNKSITPELIKYEFVKKWDGKAPQVISDQVMNILDLNQKR